VLTLVQKNLGTYLMVLVIELAAAFAAGLAGSLLCGVGLYFTTFYALLVSHHAIGPGVPPGQRTNRPGVIRAWFVLQAQPVAMEGTRAHVGGVAMEGWPVYLAAFGLSGSAGLNAYLPLLVVALMARFTPLIELRAPWTALTSWWTIGVLVVLLVVETVADKSPRRQFTSTT